MNTWITPTHGEDLAEVYARHSSTLRGALRHHLVDRALTEHLADARPQRVLDIGGGTGVQARMLAERGHEVTVLDPDEEMLNKARLAWQRYSASVSGSVGFLHGVGERAPQCAGTGWDAVLCHGVLMYLEDPAPLLRALARCVRPGGLVSVLAKQAAALAMRRGLQRDWDGVVEALHTTAELSNLGAISRSVDRAVVLRVLAEHRIHLLHWYGVRVFTDHLGDEPVGEDFDQVLEAEWAAGQVDPYRRVARHYHLIARAESDSA
ncbi:methyltransferase domain-containing protein [Streptomyces sp. NPDC048248]|uniref:methyltransferase domain-containing protein n=1 Tax=Streptomyces sp. NPDC048248 TaxID=3365523 RepID=UPI00371BDBD9